MMTTHTPAIRMHTRSTRQLAVLAAGAAISVLLGVVVAMNPLLGIGLFVVTMAVAGFLRSGTFAVSAFVACAYFEMVGAYTGVAMSPIKLTGGALVIAATIALLQPGASGRRLRNGIAWRHHPALIACLITFVSWSAMSVTWATNQHQVQTLALRLTTDALVFLAIGVFIQRPDQLRTVAIVVFVSAVASTVLGMVFGTQLLERFIGGFDDPNDYAAAMVPSIALGYVLYERARSMLTRVGILIGIALCMYGIVASESRGGLLALAVALITIVVTARGRERVRMGGFLAMFVAAGVLLIAMTPSGARVSAKMTHGDSSGRTDLWHVATNMIRASPIRGVGLGNYPAVSRHYLDSQVVHAELFTQFPRVVHNTPLEILAELGIVGGIAYYGFILACVALCIRGLRSARRQRDADLILMGRGLLSAVLASLAACIFLSGQYAEVLWVMLGLAVAYHAITIRRGRAMSHAGDSASGQ